MMSMTYRMNDVDCSLDLLFNSNLLTTYRFGDDGSYFHPVRLTNGASLTLDFPYDHPWHHGLFFNWKYINEKNFWEFNLPESERGRVTTVGELTVVAESNHCQIGQTLSWHTLDGTVYLDETRNIMVQAPDENGDYRIDFKHRFVAKQFDLVLDRVPPEQESWGGYAGLSFRPVRSMANGRILNSERAEGVSSVHGSAARWCDYSGRLDGQDGGEGGIAIYDHPNNPRFPAAHYVWDAGNLQFLQSAFLFDGSWRMDRGDKLELAYRVFVHGGFPSYDRLEREFATFKSGI